MKILVMALFLLFLPALGGISAETKKEEYFIEVYFDLFIGRVFDGRSGLVLEFPVTLPAKKLRLPQRGVITAVEVDPWWYPPPGVKARYLSQRNIRLNNAYPPGDAMNFMGKFKWTLEFRPGSGYFPGDVYTRFHEEIRPERIGTKDSAACIRLLRDSGLFLSGLFQKAVRVEFAFVKSPAESVLSSQLLGR